MVEVKNTVKSLEGRVQRLQQQLNGLCPETTLETQLPVFPLTSEKDVAALEPKLGRPEFRKEMVSKTCNFDITLKGIFSASFRQNFQDNICNTYFLRCGKDI